MSRWLYPLRRPKQDIVRSLPGSFGSCRKHDIHTGVDLYCPEGESVWAVEPGKILKVEQFTGARAESPWWEDTWAVFVEGESGIVVYGELSYPVPQGAGSFVSGGALVGWVQRVLKEDKGRPTSMLHLELYSKGGECPVWWHHDENQPKNLLDPTKLLRESMEWHT